MTAKHLSIAVPLEMLPDRWVQGKMVIPITNIKAPQETDMLVKQVLYLRKVIILRWEVNKIIILRNQVDDRLVQTPLWLWDDENP